jgi:hypothetical protein
MVELLSSLKWMKRLVSKSTMILDCDRRYRMFPEVSRPASRADCAPLACPWRIRSDSLEHRNGREELRLV